MGNTSQHQLHKSKGFSFQPMLSYRLAKTFPTSLIPADLLKQLLPWREWSLLGQQYTPNAQQWDFLTCDWSLKRRWKVLLFCSQDLYEQNVYEQNIVSTQKSVFKQIDKDVKRTYPNSDFYNDTENIDAFSRILKNIANYFPESGYTQGINFIVGFLQQCGFREEETFWMFIHLALSSDIFMMGFYQDQFPLANLSHELFMYLMRQHYPKLAAKITKLDLPKQIWVFQWFLTFYLNSFPADVCKIFWDYMIVAGPFSIVYIALGIIDQTYKDLIELHQDSDFGIYFQNLKDRQLLFKTVNFDKLFLKSKQLQLNPTTLAAAISQISQFKGYNNVYSQYYSHYDNPEKSKLIYERYLRQVKKDRLFHKIHTNRNNMIRSSKMINPIQFCMTDSQLKQTKPKGIPSLILLKHLRQVESKRTLQLEQSDEQHDSSDYGYYFRYPKDKSRTVNDLK